MTRALPWHLNGAATYHNNTDCPVGTSGDVLRYALGGSGEKHLCGECQRMNDLEGPRVRLASLDGVAAVPAAPADAVPVPVAAPERDLAALLRANLLTVAMYAAVTLAMEGYFRVEEVARPFIGGPAVALLALIIGGIRVWPGVLLGAAIVNVAVFAFPVNVAVLHAAVTVLAAGSAAALMQFRSRARRPALTLEEVLKLLAFGVLLHSMLAAAGHFWVDVALGRAAVAEASRLVGHGFVHSLAKVMISVPAVMLLWIDRRPFSRDRWPEMAAIATLVIALSAARMLPLDLPLHPSIPFVILFVFTWLSMRFTQREGFLLFSLAMMVATVGTGIDATTATAVGSGVIVGFSVAACMANVLLVSAIADERRVSMMLAGAHALSGAASRISFFDRARQEAARSTRHGQPLTVAVFDLDIDPGASLEETHERSAALGRSMAAVIVPRLRRRDVLAHLGHEEFVLLLPKTRLAEAQANCEYLRRAVAESGATGPSVSFGLTAFDPASDTIESSLRRAKQALRLAKEIGGNRVAAA